MVFSENQLTGFGLAPSVSLQGLVLSRVSADRVWFGPSGHLSRKNVRKSTEHLLVDTRSAMGDGQINPQLEVISVDCDKYTVKKLAISWLGTGTSITFSYSVLCDF